MERANFAEGEEGGEKPCLIILNFSFMSNENGPEISTHFPLFLCQCSPYASENETQQLGIRFKLTCFDGIRYPASRVGRSKATDDVSRVGNSELSKFPNIPTPNKWIANLKL